MGAADFGRSRRFPTRADNADPGPSLRGIWIYRWPSAAGNDSSVLRASARFGRVCERVVVGARYFFEITCPALPRFATGLPTPC